MEAEVTRCDGSARHRSLQASHCIALVSISRAARVTGALTTRTPCLTLQFFHRFSWLQTAGERGPA